MDRMLAEEIIELTATEWARQNFFALKKTESLQFCFHHRLPNTMTAKDSYALL